MTTTMRTVTSHTAKTLLRAALWPWVQLEAARTEAALLRARIVALTDQRDRLNAELARNRHLLVMQEQAYKHLVAVKAAELGRALREAMDG